MAARSRRRSSGSEGRRRSSSSEGGLVGPRHRSVSPAILGTPAPSLDMDMSLTMDMAYANDADGGAAIGASGWSGLHIQRADSGDILYKTDKPAKIVGPYVIGDLIGSGSFAKVKEAVHVQSLQRVAVKILKTTKLRRLNNGTGTANAKKEIRILNKLHHKHVIKLLDVYYSKEKEKVYVFNEYCAGTLQELLDSVDSKKFPLHQAQDYFRQLMDGVEYIHSQGVIHRDIKPSNLLLSNNDVVKISDFGVADIVDRFSPTSTCTSGNGTAPFMAPELHNGLDGCDSCKADVWACGVTLWNFCTGTYPFDHEEGIINLMTQITKGDYAIPDGLDEPLEGLLKGILTVDLDTRFSVDQVRRHPWVVSNFEGVDQSTRLLLPPRPDGQNDPDRGTTLMPFLYTVHPFDNLKAQLAQSHSKEFNLPTKNTASSPRLRSFLSSLFK